MAAERTKFKKRKLMVFDDDLEVICARTNKTVLKFSPRTSNIDEKGQKQLDKERGRDDNGVLIGPEEDETSPDEFTGLTGSTSNREYRGNYRTQQEQINKQWTSLREELLLAAIANAGMPSNQMCMICEKEYACLRCVDCGPNQFFCKECGHKLHKNRNQFHYIEHWLNDREFCPYMEQPIPNLQLSNTLAHKEFCSRSVRLVIVVDHFGRQHLANIELCSCYNDAKIFVQHNLWPASPNKPQFCFQFKFLDTIENMLLANQTSLKGFCDGVKETLPKLIQNNGKDIYRGLKGQTFAEYKHFKYELRSLHTICPDLSPGNVCPGCPKESGSLFITMDACFGLVRKKSASKHILPSRHSDLYFLDQENVDHFVQSYKYTKASRKHCSNFNAGSAASENLNRNRLFDIKAVFGSVCRHELPCLFLNLKHGERIAYPVLLIKEHLEKLIMKPDIQLHLSYDIACILKRHLESSKQQTISSKINLSLPAFHSYAHRPSCQIALGAKYTENNGLMDGEQCERLWSYLRCFNSITKEMSASNRKDLLTEALLYYSRKKIKKLPELLCKRIVKARNLAAESKESLEQLLHSLHVPVSIDDVAYWVQEQKENGSLATDYTTENVFSWQKQYIQMILSNRQLRQTIMMEDGTEDVLSQNVSSLRSSEKELKEFEKTHKIRNRWDLGSAALKDLVFDVIDSERSELVRNLRVVAYERVFLIGLKRKYADGQKLAKSLSRSINQKVAAMENLLKPFNKKISCLKKYFPEIKQKMVDMKAAFNLENEIYNEVDTQNQSEVPACLKMKAITLFNTRQRSLEEIRLLKNDAQCLLKFFIKEMQKITSTIANLDASSFYNIGARSLLYEELSMLAFFTGKAIVLFEQPSYFGEDLELNVENVKSFIQERQNLVKNIENVNLEFNVNEDEEDNGIEEIPEYDYDSDEQISEEMDLEFLDF